MTWASHTSKSHRTPPSHHMYIMTNPTHTHAHEHHAKTWYPHTELAHQQNQTWHNRTKMDCPQQVPQDHPRLPEEAPSTLTVTLLFVMPAHFSSWALAMPDLHTWYQQTEESSYLTSPHPQHGGANISRGDGPVGGGTHHQCSPQCKDAGSQETKGERGRPMLNIGRKKWHSLNDRSEVYSKRYSCLSKLQSHACMWQLLY